MIYVTFMGKFDFLDLWKGKRYMKEIPGDHHVTYQFQYRKCGKPTCSTCRSGPGHGPYWYAYWREGSRLRSGYIGKVHPSLKKPSISLVKKPDTITRVVLEQMISASAAI
jgi:hypothetical protein